MSELLAGARIALPSAVNTILDLLKLGQQAMFGFFLTGTILAAILLPATALTPGSRRWSIFIAIIAFVSGLCVNAAAVIATVLAVGAKYALTAQDQLNIRVNIGVRMFVFMWLAGALTTVAFILHAAMGCFCLRGRKAPSEGSASPEVAEVKRRSRFPDFVRRRRAGVSA